MPPAPVVVGIAAVGVDVALVELLGVDDGSGLVLGAAGALGVVAGEPVGGVVVVGATTAGELELPVSVVDGAVTDGSPDAVKAGISVSVPPSSPAQEVKQLGPMARSSAMDQVEAERSGVVFMSRTDG